MFLHRLIYVIQGLWYCIWYGFAEVVDKWEQTLHEVYMWTRKFITAVFCCTICSSIWIWNSSFVLPPKVGTCPGICIELSMRSYQRQWLHLSLWCVDIVCMQGCCTRPIDTLGSFELIWVLAIKRADCSSPGLSCPCCDSPLGNDNL